MSDVLSRAKQAGLKETILDRPEAEERHNHNQSANHVISVPSEKPPVPLSEVFPWKPPSKPPKVDDAHRMCLRGEHDVGKRGVTVVPSGGKITARATLYCRRPGCGWTAPWTAETPHPGDRYQVVDGHKVPPPFEWTPGLTQRAPNAGVRAAAGRLLRAWWAGVRRNWSIRWKTLRDHGAKPRS